MIDTRNFFRALSIFVFVVSGVLAPSPSFSAGTTMTAEELSRLLVVQDVTEQGGTVSGRLLNKSENVIRDVKLLVQFSWRWKNERHPGKDDMSFAADTVVSEAIEPGQSAAFTYRAPNPPPSRRDGFFHVEVTVASFTREILHKP